MAQHWRLRELSVVLGVLRCHEAEARMRDKDGRDVGPQTCQSWYHFVDQRQHRQGTGEGTWKWIQLPSEAVGKARQ